MFYIEQEIFMVFRFSVFLAALLLTVLTVQAQSPTPFVLSKDGMSKAAIVIAPNAGNGTRHAATELAKYLGKITDGNFAVADQPIPGYNLIYVGTPYNASKPEEICIRVKDAKTLEVTGDGQLGTLFAVYDLLETFGVGFYACDFEDIPSRPNLDLPGDYQKTDAPFMHWRQMVSHLGWHDFDYCMKQRMNGTMLNRFGERLRNDFGGGYEGNFNQTVTYEYVSAKTCFETHPEWFAWNRSKNARSRGGVCVSNEAMFQQLFKEVGEKLEKNPNLQEIGLGAPDGLVFCECEKCLELSRSDNNPEGAEVPAIHYIILLNRVARHFAAKYPKVRFNILAYDFRGQTNAEKFKFEPNAGTGLANLWRNFGIPLEVNDRAPSEVDRWAKLSDKNGMYVWDYYANFANYITPFPNLDTMGANFRYYKRLGVTGSFPQMQHTYFGDMAELHYWLLGKLAWNPDADDKQLIDQFVNGTYGLAAPYIHEYIDLLERAKKRKRGVWIGCYVADTSHYLTAEDSIKMLQLFANAERVVRNDADRLKMVRRASLSVYTNAIFRYNDMIEPAKKMRYGLPDREKLWQEWQTRSIGTQDTDEGGQLVSRLKKVMEKPATPTVFPERKQHSIYIDARMMTGGTRMTKQRDPDGFDFARIQVSLNNEVEHIFMNPEFAEVGYTIKPEQAGEWYVFAKVRVGACIARDYAAAYVGIYSPWIIDGETFQPLTEIADIPVLGTQGDDSWQVICLGKYKLVPGARVWLMPGVNNPTKFADVQNFLLVDPAVIEGTVTKEPGNSNPPPK